MENITSDFFYGTACDPNRYAHLKNCTDVYFDQSSIIGLKTVFDTNRHLYLEDTEFVNGDENLIGLKTTIDTRQHIYLNDHIFSGSCFVPAAMIIEILVESANWFLEFYLKADTNVMKVVGLENLNIERALALKPGGAIESYILLDKVEKKEDNIRMKINIVSKRMNSQGQAVGNRLNVSSEVLASNRGQEKIVLPDWNLDFDFYNLSKELYYSSYFPYLKHMFQSATGRFAVDKDRNILIGEYDCENKEKDFIKGQELGFTISPLGYDSCIQYTVFLSRIKALIGRLPVAARKINIYKRHPDSGRVKVLVKCLDIDDELMISNFWTYDSDGHILMSSEGFVVKKSPLHKYGDRSEFDRIMARNKTDFLEW